MNTKIEYLLPLNLKIFIIGNNILNQKYITYYEDDFILKLVGEEFGCELMGGLSYKY